MHWGNEGRSYPEPGAPRSGQPPSGSTAPPARDGGPWWSRLLSERGLGTVLAVVLVGAMLWLLIQLVAGAQSYQSTSIAEAARTNEKLSQLQLSHSEMAIQLDRIERMLLAQQGRPP
jgi:hypothetical protein